MLFNVYLYSVQRKGADNIWVRYWCILENFIVSCYISQRDLTLALSIQLLGSRIMDAGVECQRKHSFSILHTESGQHLYFAADNYEEFYQWFSEITRGGQHVLSDDSSDSPFLSYYSIPKEIQVKRLSVVSEGDSSSNISESSTVASGSADQSLSVGAFYRGDILKSSHTGKWKQRYCIVKNGFLNIFHYSSEKSPITSIPLYGCSLELISVSSSSQHKFQFKLNPATGDKSHTFAASSETEMYTWISALRDASLEVTSSVIEKSNGHVTTPMTSVSLHIF